MLLIQLCVQQEAFKGNSVEQTFEQTFEQTIATISVILSFYSQRKEDTLI